MPYIIRNKKSNLILKMEHETSYNRDEWVREHAERFFRFDCIRLSKLYELVIYSMFTIVAAVIVGACINEFCAPYAHEIDKYSTMTLVWVAIISNIMIVLSAYYIPKFVSIIPALFPVGCGYVPSKHNEAETAIGIGMGLSFFVIIANFYTIMNELVYRIFPFMFKYNKPDPAG